jgi:hypothetical protein
MLAAFCAVRRVIGFSFGVVFSLAELPRLRRTPKGAPFA